MKILDYMRTVDVEIFVGDLLEEANPNTIEEIERMAEQLHNAIEIGIKDYIESEEDRFDYDEYNPPF